MKKPKGMRVPRQLNISVTDTKLVDPKTEDITGDEEGYMSSITFDYTQVLVNEKTEKFIKSIKDGTYEDLLSALELMCTEILTTIMKDSDMKDHMMPLNVFNKRLAISYIAQLIAADNVGNQDKERYKVLLSVLQRMPTSFGEECKNCENHQEGQQCVHTGVAAPPPEEPEEKQSGPPKTDDINAGPMPLGVGLSAGGLIEAVRQYKRNQDKT